jgi:5,10-methylene-tetrahydrofolate dehydrogenase/methenyl tetrahydrofolate cyclohydrolase
MSCVVVRYVARCCEIHYSRGSHLGANQTRRELPETVSQEELLKVVQDFNADPNVHGILVQLPVRALSCLLFQPFI